MQKYPYNADLGQTDLMGAAYNRDPEAIDAILELPCDIDAQDSHGITALMYAAMQRHSESAKGLSNTMRRWSFNPCNDTPR